MQIEEVRMSTVRSILDQKGSEVVTVLPTDTLAQAILKLTQHRIGAVLVLDEKGGIKGILSERDVVKHLAGRIEFSTTVSVSDVMTKGVTYVKPHQSLDECLQLMTTGRFRHLPVVDNDAVVGIISIGDVVKAVLADRAFQIGQLEYYITNTF
jgi:CBS domain-containing protein